MTATHILLQLLVDLAVKGTIVLLVTLLVARVAHKAPAATLHRIWITGFIALLLVPVGRLALPRLETTLLPGIAALELGTSGPRTVPRPVGIVPAQTAVPSGVRQSSSAHDALSAQPSDSRAVTFPWLVVILGVWLAGVLLVLARLAVGTIVLGRRARAAQLISDSQLLGDVQRLARAHGVRRPVTVLQADAPCVPVTWGTLYPVLLLPPEAPRWSSERRTLVVMHEVAHIARLDSLTQFVAHVAVALCWFQPLAWLAVGRSRQERERACDDFVLANGTAPSQYAIDLLALAETIPAAPTLSFSVIGVVGTTELDRRIRAILNRTMRRDPRLRAWSRGVTTALCVALPFAMLAPAAVPPTAAPHGRGAEQADSMSQDVFVTGLGMRERVAARNRRGGLALVMEDRDRLRTDIARREFWLALLDLVGPLGRADLGDIAIATRDIPSDADRTPVLDRVLRMGGSEVVDAVCEATSGAMSEETTATIVAGALRIDSTGGAVPSCFEAIELLRSDSLKASALLAALEHPASGASLLMAVAKASRTIVAPDMRRRVLDVALRHGAAANASAARALRSARTTLN